MLKRPRRHATAAPNTNKLAVDRLTARHEGSDRPHTHLVDAAALATAKRAAVQHIRDCVVCALAYVAVQQRSSEFQALGVLDSTPTASRDQLYAETHILYCGHGTRARDGAGAGGNGSGR